MSVVRPFVELDEIDEICRLGVSVRQILPRLPSLIAESRRFGRFSSVPNDRVGAPKAINEMRMPLKLPLRPALCASYHSIKFVRFPCSKSRSKAKFHVVSRDKSFIGRKDGLSFEKKSIRVIYVYSKLARFLPVISLDNHFRK